jgi:hypothetical protein
MAHKRIAKIPVATLGGIEAFSVICRKDLRREVPICWLMRVLRSEDIIKVGYLGLLC